MAPKITNIPGKFLSAKIVSRTKDLKDNLDKTTEYINFFIDIEFLMRASNIILRNVKAEFKEVLLKAGGLDTPHDTERAINSFHSEVDIQTKTIVIYDSFPDDLLKAPPEHEDQENKNTPKNPISKEALKKLKDEKYQHSMELNKIKLKEQEIKKRQEIRKLARKRGNQFKKIAKEAREYFNSINKASISQGSKNLINVEKAVHLVLENAMLKILGPKEPFQLKGNTLVMIELDTTPKEKEFEPEESSQQETLNKNAIKKTKPKSKRKIVLKKAPLKTKSTHKWIHPGITRQNFMIKAFAKSESVINKLLEEKLKVLKKLRYLNEEF